MSLKVRERVWAVVPAKAFADAKSRLAPALDAAGRTRLACTMLVHAIEVIEGSGVVEGILVATDGNDVERACAGHAVEILHDRSEDHGRLGRVVDRALEALSTRGAGAALVVMGDLPRLAVEDVRALLDALASADLALAPDHAEAGTNALACRLPAPMPSEFGHADSLTRHLAAARRLGLAANVVRTPGFAHDVDAPEDL